MLSNIKQKTRCHIDKMQNISNLIKDKMSENIVKRFLVLILMF